MTINIKPSGKACGAEITGVDLTRTLLDEDYSGFELLGDYRILKHYFIAAELGNEQFDYNETNLEAFTKGSYIKVGANYNAYDNWIGMSNEIFVGLRYGFSTFSQELQSYTIYTDTPFFDPRFQDDTPSPTPRALAPHKAAPQGNFHAALNEKQFPNLAA